MSNFESPLGNKKFGNTNMREFNIPDESVLPEMARESVNPVFRRQMAVDQSSINDFQNRINSETSMADAEKEFREAREAKKTGKERLSEGARRRIEMLIGMTRSSREFSFAENTFILQTLKAKEMREAIMAAAEFAGTVQEPFEIRRQFLARSLTQVAGVEIEQFIGSSSLESRLAFIDEVDDVLLNRLYDEYLLLLREAKEKYSITTTEAAKEIIDDLKK